MGIFKPFEWTHKKHLWSQRQHRLPTSGNSDWLICPLHQFPRAAITNYHKLSCLIYCLPFLEATSGGQRADSELLAELISSWRFRGRVHSMLLSQFLVKWSEVKVTQSCLTLCDPMNSTVHGILLAADNPPHFLILRYVPRIDLIFAWYCPCVTVSLFYKDTSPGNRVPPPSDLILTQLHLQRPYFPCS